MKIRGPRRSTRTPQGFTLIELLIALTLLALMLGVLFTSLHTGGRAWDAGTARTEEAGEMMAAQQLLRRTLESAHPMRLADASGNPVVAFSGDSQSVSFVSASPSAARTEGHYIYTLRLSEGTGGGRALALHVEPYYPGEVFAGPDDSGEEIILLDPVDGMDIRYFGALKADADPGWHNEWQEMPTLPLLLRIEILSARDWPVLHAAPRIDVGVANIVTADPAGTLDRFLRGGGR